MNVSTRQLKAFLAVARFKSFTRAAEELHITQQGLSLLIQEVEKQFGARLFDRTTRSVSLTDAGRQLVAVATQAVGALDDVASEIDRLNQNAAQSISVAVTPFIAATLMPEICLRFQRQYPEVTVRVLDIERTQLQPALESGAADLGFGIFLKPSASLHRRVIFQCEMICVSKASGRESGRSGSAQRLRWRDLGGTTLIGLPDDNVVQQLVNEHLPPRVREDSSRASYNNIPTILGMVEAGFGSAVLPSFTAAALDRTNLEAVLLEDPTVPVEFYQINLKGRRRADAEARFVETLLETMRDMCTFGS